MKVHKSFRYRIYPTIGQAEALTRWTDGLRFLWNLANEQRLRGMARPRSERRYFSLPEQQRQFTELRHSEPWLKSCASATCAK